jgi:protein-tyrosine-phosphatase
MPTALAAPAPDLLKLLADDRRWALVHALARSDRRVQELVGLLQQPTNLVSYHLRKLRDHAVVTERRSAGDRRDVYYSLDFDRVRDLYFGAASSLHPALGSAPVDAAPSAARPSRTSSARRRGQRPKVLFVCTHNSARSQMAEGFLRHLRPDLMAASAGTEVSQVQPLAIRVMKRRDIDISEQRSKLLTDFDRQSFDYVITVCDRAREACPVLPGNPELLHWSIADPSEAEGDTAFRLRVYEHIADEVEGRLRRFLALFLPDPERASTRASRV